MVYLFTSCFHSVLTLFVPFSQSFFLFIPPFPLLFSPALALPLLYPCPSVCPVFPLMFAVYCHYFIFMNLISSHPSHCSKVQDQNLCEFTFCPWILQQSGNKRWPQWIYPNCRDLWEDDKSSGMGGKEVNFSPISTQIPFVLPSNNHQKPKIVRNKNPEVWVLHSSLFGF